MNPLVSVIMPTNNRHMFVAQAISYFKRYTSVPAELIIVDSGTRPLNQKYLQDNHIRYIGVPSHMTIGEMLNTGIRASNGRIIARQDDDDWYSCDRLEHLVKILKSSKSGIVGPSPCLNYAMFLRVAWKYTSLGGALAFYREIWDKTPFPDIHIQEDIIFLKEAEKISGEKWTITPDDLNLYIHINHFCNISGITIKRIDDSQAFLKVKEVMGQDFNWYDSFAETQIPFNVKASSAMKPDGDNHAI